MNGIVIILTAIVLSAFFSGMEIAFITANKLRIELDIKQRAFGSRFIKKFTDNPGQYIATMLLGNNIALVIYGLFFSKLLTPFLTPLIGSDVVVLLLNTVVSTGIILIVAEFLPKTIFKINPNFFLKLFSGPSIILYYLFYPVSTLTLAASNLLIRMISPGNNDDRKKENLVFSKLDLDHFVNLNKAPLDETESFHRNIKIFKNALDFSKVKLRECMVPRTEIDAIECKSSLPELKERFIETGHSRIIIYRDTIDNIIGYFELKDIFKDPPDIISFVRKVAIVPETMAANKLLKIFFDEKKNVALVVDEFGGTSGIVTIEDVLEEIVGDIEDEHDINELIEKKVGEQEYILSGRLEVDYLNEKYNLGFPEDGDYATLAGLILFYNGSIPAVNDIIRIERYTFRILRVTATRLELVNLRIDQ